MLLQLLVVATQPRDVTTQQHAFNRQSSPAALPLHRHLRAARHAAVRWQVQLRRQPGQAAQQLRHVLAVAYHRLSGNLLTASAPLTKSVTTGIFPKNGVRR